MSYPPQDPYHNPGAAPAPGPGFPADGQYSAPPNPTAPMPGYGAPAQPAPASYDQGYAAGGYDPNGGFGQTSAPPVSAPPPPFSAPPSSGPPVVGPPSPYGAPAAAKGKPTVLILAVVAGLLFVLGGVMTGLFITTNNELNDTRQTLTAQVAERDTTISTKEGEISKLQSDLKTAQDELDATNQTLSGTQADRDRIEKEKAAISKCLNLVSDFLGALAAQDSAKAESLANQLDAPCDEAEKYL